MPRLAGHRERLVAKPTQTDLARRRMAEYAAYGKHPGNLPGPGTYARHNAVDSQKLRSAFQKYATLDGQRKLATRAAVLHHWSTRQKEHGR